MDRLLRGMGFSDLMKPTPIGRFVSKAEQELELGGLIELTLISLLDETGYSDMAFFTKNQCGGYDVGGYARRSLTRGEADMLFDLLSSDVPYVLADTRGAIYLKDKKSIEQHFSNAGALVGCEVLGAGIGYGEENKGGILLFREGKAYQPNEIMLLEQIAQVVDNQIGLIRRVHHRLRDVPSEYDDPHTRF